MRRFYQAQNPVMLNISFIVVGILCFASLVYICESELRPEVPTIYKNTTIYIKVNTTWTFPECFWWGLMTITTVGYDVNPDVRMICLDSSPPYPVFFLRHSLVKYLVDCVPYLVCSPSPCPYQLLSTGN